MVGFEMSRRSKKTEALFVPNAAKLSTLHKTNSISLEGVKAINRPLIFIRVNDNKLISVDSFIFRDKNDLLLNFFITLFSKLSYPSIFIFSIHS